MGVQAQSDRQSTTASLSGSVQFSKKEVEWPELGARSLDCEVERGIYQESWFRPEKVDGYEYER